MKKLLLIALLLSVSQNSIAFGKAEELLWACNAGSKDDPVGYMHKAKCFGYISGVLDGMQMVFSIKPESRFVCPPASGMSLDQQVRIVLKHLEDNPNELHESARSTVLVAFQRAFTCE